MEQMLLIRVPNPLAERFGEGFFKNLSKTPGVYLMKDISGKIIYIGQSKSLRQRLTSYRSIQPEKSSKRLVRLVNRVQAIDIIKCETAGDAIVLEDQLIRQHNPTYNRAQVYPQRHPYWEVKWENQLCVVSVIRSSSTPEIKDKNNRIYGCFPAWASSLALMSAHRLLHINQKPSTQTHHLPQSFFQEKAPALLTLDFVGNSESKNLFLKASWKAFLDGKNRSFLWIIGIRGLFCFLRWDRPLRTALIQDWLLLFRFFASGPRKNRLWKKKNRIDQNNPVIHTVLSEWTAEKRAKKADFKDRSHQKHSQKLPILSKENP